MRNSTAINKFMRSRFSIPSDKMGHSRQNWICVKFKLLESMRTAAQGGRESLGQLIGGKGSIVISHILDSVQRQLEI